MFKLTITCNNQTMVLKMTSKQMASQLRAWLMYTVDDDIRCEITKETKGTVDDNTK